MTLSNTTVHAEQRSIAKSWVWLWVAYNMILTLVVSPVLIGNPWLMQNVRFVTEVAFAAFVANLCFLAGPGAEVMLSIFGMRGKVLRGLIFAGGTALATLIAYLAMLAEGPSVELAIGHAESEVTVVIPALETYRFKHGQYPDSLQPLVAEYLLNLVDVPEIGKHWNMESQPLTYKVSKDGSRFVVWFAYHAHFQGIGPGDTTYHYYTSAAKRWVTDQSGPSEIE